MDFDDVSLLATCEAERPLIDIERELNREGWTLGFVLVRGGASQSIRKILERRIPNRYSLRYGEIDEICLSLKVSQKGKMWETKRVPRSAAGPDFKRLLIGSGGRYGTILEATFRVVPMPERRTLIRVRWSQAGGRRTFLKKIAASGIRPAEIRPQTGGLRIGLEGPGEIVAAETACLRKLARETRGRVQAG